MNYYQTTFTVEYEGQTAKVSSSFVEGVEIFSLKWADGTLDFFYMDIVGDIIMWQSKRHLPKNLVDDIGLQIEKNADYSRVIN